MASGKLRTPRRNDTRREDGRDGAVLRTGDRDRAALGDDSLFWDVRSDHGEFDDVDGGASGTDGEEARGAGDQRGVVVSDWAGAGVSGAGGVGGSVGGRGEGGDQGVDPDPGVGGGGGIDRVWIDESTGDFIDLVGAAGDEGRKDNGGVDAQSSAVGTEAGERGDVFAGPGAGILAVHVNVLGTGDFGDDGGSLSRGDADADLGGDDDADADSGGAGRIDAGVLSSVAQR